MDTKTAAAIMEYIIEFTKVNNLTESNTVQVVNFQTLTDRFEMDMQKEYVEMMKHYNELFEFLMKRGRHIYDKKSNTKWTYRIMHGKNYIQDNRYKKQIFLPLQQKKFYKYNLFVLYQEPTPLKYYGTEEEYHTLTKKLTKDIELCFEENTSNEKKYQYQNHLVDYLNIKFQNFFDTIKITVEIIGSAHTKLDLDDSDLNLGIRIAPSEIKEGALLCNTQNWKNTLYDPYYLAQFLRKIGMQATLPIPTAKRTQFTEPKLGLKCFVGVDDGLVFERDILITEYLKLDKRVKPLIIAILKLSRSQRINKSLCLSTLSTQSYVMMTLHFLMNVLENPVIPNLQSLPVECKWTDCSYNMKDELVPTFFDNRIENLDVRYHNCVRIVNKKTSKYNSDNNNEIKPTIWYSENSDNLGTLFLDFITYYSERDNYKIISIARFEKEQSRDVVWVQDPYLEKKNIAASCKYVALRIIARVFSTVADMLKEGYSYQEVCDRRI